MHILFFRVFRVFRVFRGWSCWLPAVLAACPFAGQAQAPESSVYAFAMEEKAETYELRDPILLTGFNPDAYNNHPSFINDSTLLIVSTPAAGEQPDIFALDLKNRTRRRLTATEAGEYSPRLMPDYFHLSAVRMELRGSDTLLRVWKFPLNGSGSGQPVLPDLDNVGYYHWLSSTDLAVFLVGDTLTLGVAHLFSETIDTIDTRVGRCFRSDADGDLLYVRKVHPERWELMEWDPDSGRSRFVVATLPRSEDFAVHGNGDLLMGSGGKLYAFSPGEDPDWREIADLSRLGIDHITRLEWHRNGILALVEE